MEVYAGAHLAPEWDVWVAEESSHVSWYRNSTPGLCCVQTGTIQPAIGAALIASMSKNQVATRLIPFAFLVWSPAMSETSALSCGILQLLERYSEILLYRQPSDFYIRRFQEDAISFGSMWQIFLDMVSALSGLCCCFLIPCGAVDALNFAKMVDLYLCWSRSPLHILIYHEVDCNPFGVPFSMEIDTAYDIEPEFDTSEAFAKVLWSEQVAIGSLSEEMRHFL
jgi:hypothetical protein